MTSGSISWTSTMVHVVILILASGFLKSLCDASCDENEPRRMPRGQKLTGCMDNDTMREFNSTWLTKECLECCCYPNGVITCCTKVNKPIPMDSGCIVLFNQTTCSYTMKRKDNSSKPCGIRGVM